MKQMNEKDKKMLVRETERAIQLRDEMKGKQDELLALHKDVEKAHWRRDVLRLRRNIEEYAETIFTWKTEFLASEIGKQLCDLGEGYVWLRQHYNKSCRLFQDGYLEVIMLQRSGRDYQKTKSTHITVKQGDITRTALDPCDKDDVNVARLYEDIALEIKCGKIYDVILSNYREWPAYGAEYF